MKRYTLLALLMLVAAVLSGCGGSNNESFGVGDAAPDFALTNTDGSTYQLSENLGEKPVLLFFHMADG